MKNALRTLGLLSVALLFGAAEARAYTDPGSGALLWQILVGALTGSLFYVRRIVNWFNRNKHAKVAATETRFSESENHGQ